MSESFLSNFLTNGRISFSTGENGGNGVKNDSLGRALATLGTIHGSVLSFFGVRWESCQSTLGLTDASQKMSVPLTERRLTLILDPSP